MDFYIYNTLTRQKEKFIPISKEEVKVYSCGPTVYNYVHIGNLRTFLFQDILVRSLRMYGYKVNQVMNITDVDDKTIRNSNKQGMPLKDYTDIYKKALFEDLNTLRIAAATHYPCATDHIEEMVKHIQILINKGFAYQLDGSVYFSIKEFKTYGHLARLDKENLVAGASGRVGSDEYNKENISDFVLWKAHTEDDGDVYWDTSLGKGRPGWHIECSTMSMTALGENFDIHTGGVDLIFPHHENEIAQSEAISGKKFVNYWMHAEFLNMGAEKMSKSLGNIYTLRELLEEGFSPEAIRYTLISSKYRQPLSFTFDLIKQNSAAIERVNSFIQKLWQIVDGKTNQESKENGSFKKGVMQAEYKFKESLYDDLNTSSALAAIFDLIALFLSNVDTISKANAKDALTFLKLVNGIIACFEVEKLNENEFSWVEDLIKERERARKDKQFNRADEIRNELLAKGIELEDSRSGTTWKKK